MYVSLTLTSTFQIGPGSKKTLLFKSRQPFLLSREFFMNWAEMSLKGSSSRVFISVCGITSSLCVESTFHCAILRVSDLTIADESVEWDDTLCEKFMSNCELLDYSCVGV